MAIFFSIIAVFLGYRTSKYFPKGVPFFIKQKSNYRFEKTVFFTSWLLLIIMGFFWNDLKKLNSRYLILGGIISLFVPVFNGVVTGDWFFFAFAKAQYTIASIDTFWLFTGISALLIVYSSRSSKNLSE